MKFFFHILIRIFDIFIEIDSMTLKIHSYICMYDRDKINRYDIYSLWSREIKNVD